MNNMTHDFNRTTCACKECVQCCKRQPGPLAPGDFERIAEYLGETSEQAKEHFCASPGALVGDSATGETARVGSIVPRYRKGRCVFLDANDRCSIHPVAPFGCAYYDTHMSKAASMPRSLWWVRAVLNDADYERLRNTLPYTTVYRPSGY
jgi:Fe-S-cluster containining protein